MTYITAWEEMQILDCILPRIISHGKFRVDEKHFTWGILPTTLKADGSSDFEKSEETKSDFKEKGYYKAVTGFLVDNGFANYINDESNNEYVILTTKGEYLAVYGKLDAYNAATIIQLDEKELIERLPLLLAEIKPYGEFSIVPNDRVFPPNEVETLYTVTDSDGLRQLNMAIERKQKELEQIILNEHINLIKDERTVEYLVNHGFAINRFDIDHRVRLYRQLTDKGRTLKEMGSITVYKEWERTEKNKEKLRAEENDILRQTNIISGKIQRQLLTINRWIAFGTIVQALSAFVMLFVGSIKNFHWVGMIEFWVTMFVFLLGTVSGATILIILDRLLKQKE